MARRWWKWLGLAGVAGVAGVAASGAAIARDERERRHYSPDEIRARLHRRHEEAQAEGGTAGEAQPGAGSPGSTPGRP